MMNDDELESPIREMAQEYHSPADPDREAMWARIQARRRADRMEPAGTLPRVPGIPLHRWAIPVGMAALLALAFGLGRVSRERDVAATPAVPAPGPAPAPRSDGLVHQVAAEEYFGRVEVFLTELPRVTTDTAGKEEVADQARRLLGTTRLLLDTPAGNDARLRPLLEDLELVLAGIAQLPAEPAGALDLIAEGLDQRGTLSLLRSKVSAGAMPAFNQGEL